MCESERCCYPQLSVHITALQGLWVDNAVVQMEVCVWWGGGEKLMTPSHPHLTVPLWTSNRPSGLLVSQAFCLQPDMIVDRDLISTCDKTRTVPLMQKGVCTHTQGRSFNLYLYVLFLIVGCNCQCVWTGHLKRHSTLQCSETVLTASLFHAWSKLQATNGVSGCFLIAV